MAEKIDLEKLHPGLKVLVILLPVLIIALPFYLVFYKPKLDQKKKLVTAIKALDKDIDEAQKKAARLADVEKQLELARKKYEQVKKQLPEEGEISSLLKQISDNGREAGLKITLWEPQPKVNHPSNIVYIMPVKIKMQGSYHRLGDFLSRLTSLERIVNISQMGLSNAKTVNEEAILTIDIMANTFSAIPEAPPK